MRVQETSEDLGSYDQDPVRYAGGDHACPGREGIQESRADGGNVEGCRATQPKTARHLWCRCRAGPVRRGRGQDHRIDLSQPR